MTTRLGTRLPTSTSRKIRVSALERNELKRRALEMVLVLFYIEDLKHFVIESIRATDRSLGSPTADRLPMGAKGLYRKAWAILVERGVLNQAESDELQKLIDYRNVVAHHTHALTADVGRYSSLRVTEGGTHYEGGALARVRYFRKLLPARMTPGFVHSLSFRSLHFEAAERTYLNELDLLGRKIRRQAKATRAEIQHVNSEIARLRQSGLLSILEPGRPDHIKRSGQLSKGGIDCCRGMFSAGASPLAVAYLMRVSLRASERQYKAWLSITSSVEKPEA